ncbi:MAG: hypothetical protein ACMXYC_04030 [Candidatus Woesearchaeota archaeon]
MKIKFKCSDCGYTFSRMPDFSGRCPYCDSARVQKMPQNTADKLLKESIGFE